MEISEKNLFFQNSIETSSHTYFGPIFFSHMKENRLQFHQIFLFFSNPIVRASKLSLKLKKRNCQEYGDFRKKRFFFKILLKPLPIHILGQLFSHERILTLVSGIFFSNSIGRASKLNLKLKKINCQKCLGKPRHFEQSWIDIIDLTIYE